jgi:co-chaperonin GroES (HSP10)
MHGLDENSVAYGTKVIIKNVPDDNRFIKGGIYLPQMKLENDRLVKGVVISIGREAMGEGLNVGDVVLYDMWSKFGYRGVASDKVDDFIITNVENIMLVCQE